jgi:hypothetical protein
MILLARFSRMIRMRLACFEFTSIGSLFNGSRLGIPTFEGFLIVTFLVGTAGLTLLAGAMKLMLSCLARHGIVSGT